MLEPKVLLLMITAISMSAIIVVVFYKDVSKKNKNS